MHQPKLSIIMPVYNAESYVKEAIQSALNQSFADLELIVINDGSTDKSASIIRSFSDKRMHYIENPVNSGIVFSRNKGLALARGTFIGMLDADDIAYPLKFEKQIAFLSDNEEFGMVGSWAKFIDEGGKHIAGGWKLKASSQRIPSVMLFKNYFLQSAVLYRRSCIQEFSFTEGFDILEDYLIWFEILKKYKSWNLQEYLVDYRIHGEGVTKKHQKEKLEKEKKVFRIQLAELGIAPTDGEMESHLLIRNDEPIQDLSTLKSIEKWLLKLIDRNSKTGVYEQKQFVRTVFNQWLKVCKKSMSLHVRMLYYCMNSEITRIYLRANL